MMDRAVMDRAVMDRAVMDRAVMDCAVMDRAVMDHATDGIRVNAACPRPVETESCDPPAEADMT
ncbi:hypothetical protein BE17_41595 [Sorangium cellulosum]|uniref:Uncharacterized protein n=1 Tax=Sorangium cellulosum TaxID=56 RepID=A0A150SBV9_SORCE|nr:hypothetical protein BE17_41595 [Sorangium cellulosum]